MSTQDECRESIASHTHIKPTEGVKWPVLEIDIFLHISHQLGADGERMTLTTQETRGDAGCATNFATLPQEMLLTTLSLQRGLVKKAFTSGTACRSYSIRHLLPSSSHAGVCFCISRTIKKARTHLSATHWVGMKWSPSSVNLISSVINSKYILYMTT